VAGSDVSHAAPLPHGPHKTPTDIDGLDQMTHGGLPRRRMTLVTGGAGSGKTVLALEILARGFRTYDEPGIFVAFEESPEQVLSNAASFPWAPGDLSSEQLLLVDARLSPDTIQAGDFDLGVLLAGLSAKIRAMGARRVVFDSIDALLLLLEQGKELREVYRLRDWLASEDVTCILTAKAGAPEPALERLHGRLQFIADCVIELSHRLSEEVSLRSLRILKYRGTRFSENACPMVIGAGGIELGGVWGDIADRPASKERVSSGVEELDAMLGGGYYRGSGILITGSPGTAKTTLGGVFAEAACKRGERTLVVTFDEIASEMIRNLSSVGIDLQSPVDTGALILRAVRTESKSAEEHLLAIAALLKECEPRCLVLDPISAMLKAGGGATAMAVAQRLLLLTRGLGITLVATSVIDTPDPSVEATRLQISTVADTWIHVSYAVQGGERNRALTIIKSRGTKHSNQVRELLLSDQGLTLADVSVIGGEVLMGTLRFERETEAKRSKEAARLVLDIKRRKQELAEVELQARSDVLMRELELGRAELAALSAEEESTERGWTDDANDLHRLRSTDGENDPGRPA
jgi:circadian clock protein KaiC